MRRFCEFYCRTSGGGCGGYVLLPVTGEGTYRVCFVCPKCKHRHDRGVVNGEIVDRSDQRIGTGGTTVELLPTLSAWSPEPRTRHMRAIQLKRERAEDSNRWPRGCDPEKASVAQKRSQFLSDAWLTVVGEQLP